MEVDQALAAGRRAGHCRSRMLARPQRSHAHHAFERQREVGQEMHMKKLLIMLFIASAAYAHHSAAGIDRSKSVTVEGTVKSFKWANPHSWLEVEVPNSKGGADLWNFEMNP